MNGIDFISSYMPLTYCLYIDWLIAMKKARADSFFHSHNYTCRGDNKRTRNVFLKCRTYIIWGEKTKHKVMCQAFNSSKVRDNNFWNYKLMLHIKVSEWLPQGPLLTTSTEHWSQCNSRKLKFPSFLQWFLCIKNF